MATEEPVVATEPEVQPIAAEPKKESKPRKPRARKPSTHPPYFEMISDAITSLKERNGSSQQAIQKFIEQKHKELPANFRKLLLTNLKKSVADGKLVKVKASYKFPPARNSDKSPAKKKPKKKVNAGKSSAPAKKTANKASPAKTKAGAAKPKAPAKPKAGGKRKAAEKAKEKKPAKVAKTAAGSSPGRKAAVPAKKKVEAPARAAKSPTIRASTKKVRKRIVILGVEL